MSELCQPHWETVVQMLACCLASRKRKVKQGLADVSSMEGILMLEAGFHTGTQHGGLLVSLHGGKAGPNLPAIATCEDILFLQKPYTVPRSMLASSVFYHLVLLGKRSYLRLFHSTASKKWQDLALTACVKASEGNVAFVLSIVPFLPL